ncbi:Fur family transcriptional regulator [Lentibacillus sp. N15]|uniref:Fur family transcriptional regulator n=1 Tax=Lentibacillus songyuanensis TaxID=3136161 RepID=UPI0031BB2F5A
MMIDEAFQKLKLNGYKITRKREKILFYLDRNPKYVSGKEIIDYLKKDYPGLSYATAYQNLALFGELGIIEETELNGEKKYQLSCSTHDHHHHFICLKCGKTRVIENCPMDALPKLDDFDIVGHKFEVYGYCRECQSS